ncbi:hypothetical protein LZC95_32920 [Pendulispora brunnea]|uniref:Carbohydrate kinase n=1 Tax=Pendulispora brunnea TaxID=2905690 RepID=A0ABZ2JXP4_9BACT
MSTLGIDLGTQSVRAIVLTDDGVIVGEGTAPLESVRTDGRHEQDPKAWWTAVVAAVHAARADLDASRIEAVAVDGTSGTILLANADGAPMTPALMYDDVRATAEADVVNRAGAEAWLANGYGRMQPAWALPKWLWLRHHGPAADFDQARLLHQTDFINEALVGGRVATDCSTALKTGCDLVNVRWPLPLLETLELPSRMLPPLVEPGKPLGRLGARVATLLGLRAGVRVVAGMTDSCAAQIGAGALIPGSWNCVLGTTLALKGVSETLIRDPGGAMYSHRGPNGLWLPGGASSSGAGILSARLPNADLAALGNAAAMRPDPTFFTYPLAGRGERFPFVAPDAESFSTGEPADDVEAYAAMALGLAFVERLCFDHLALLGARTDGRISFTGGGARSDYWTQLRADVLGRPVHRPRHAEPAVGMAMLAAGSSSRAVDEGVVNSPASQRHRALLRTYGTFLDAIERRGWVSPVLIAHARRRAE